MDKVTREFDSAGNFFDYFVSGEDTSEIYHFFTCQSPFYSFGKRVTLTQIKHDYAHLPDEFLIDPVCSEIRAYAPDSDQYVLIAKSGI